MSKKFIKIINWLFRFFILKYYKGLWGIKNQLKNYNQKGFWRETLLFIYQEELNRLNSWIGFDSEFSNEPLFPHGMKGIFISREAKIGSDCVIFHQVTIGSNTLIDSNIGSPTIGDNVYIGAGAKIIGNILIGDNCRIGANCVVYENMPSNSVAVNAPTRIIKKNNKLDNRFFTLREDEKGEKKWYYYTNGKWIKY